MSSEDLERYAHRPFAFQPAIGNIEHNEWLFLKRTWSEILVRNTASGKDLWVPRTYLGELSGVEDETMVLSLNRELDYRGGTLSPRGLGGPGSAPTASAPGRMNSRATHSAPVPEMEPGTAPRMRASGETSTERKLQRFILLSLAGFIVVSAIVIFVTRSHETGGTITYETVLQRDIRLTAQDGYDAVVREFGEPAEIRWRSSSGERQFQALEYPSRGLTLILMGTDREDQRYIGAKDDEWRTVHYVTLTDGATTDAILRTLPRF
jgi:hypothetical protein